MGRGVPIVVSGFSGAGKGTVMKALIEKHGGYSLSVSATTRSPRPGEQNGREYHFITKEAFEDLISGGELIEYTEYLGNYYGTPKPFVEKQLEEGRDVILEIEVEGAMQVKRLFPDAILIFVTPPTVEELYRRLRERGTESMDVVEGRMLRAEVEAEHMGVYDYLLINDTVEESVQKIHHLVEAEHVRVYRNLAACAELKKDLHAFNNRESKGAW